MRRVKKWVNRQKQSMPAFFAEPLPPKYDCADKQNKRKILMCCQFEMTAGSRKSGIIISWLNAVYCGLCEKILFLVNSNKSL